MTPFMPDPYEPADPEPQTESPALEIHAGQDETDAAVDPYPPNRGAAWHPAYGYSEPRSDERNWALAAHLGSFVAAWFALGLLAPLLVLILKTGSSPYIRRHAVESLNFQINALFWSVVLFVSIFLVVGILLLPLYGVFYVVQVILASRKASKGQDVHYPLTLRLVT
jgi:uncharacterized protein